MVRSSEGGGRPAAGRSWQTLGAVLFTFFLAPVPACGGAPEPVDPAVLAREEERMVRPFEEERTIVTDRLEIVMTANFYERLTTRVPLQGVQEEERVTREDGGTEYQDPTTTPSAPPLRLKLANTDFAVLESATVVVLGGRSDLTLQAEATGHVTVQQGGSLENHAAVRIAEGAYRPESR